MTSQRTFICPDCKTPSRYPEDVNNSYCGRCHQFKVEDWRPRCMEPTCTHFGSYYLCGQLAIHQTPPALR